MESVAIMLSLIGLVGFFSYLATQFKTKSEEGPRWNSAVKVLFNTVAFTLALLLPFAGLEIANINEWEGLETVLSVALIPTVFTYMIYLFYLIILYAEDVFNFIKSDSLDRR